MTRTRFPGTATKHTTAWIQRFRSLSNPRFAEYSGGIFTHFTPTFRPPDLTRDSRPIRHAENEHNHEHIRFAPGATAAERFLNNRKLAETLELIWREKLRAQFPAKEFVLFINNELYRVESDDTEEFIGEELEPVLKLWTVDHTTPDELAALFRTDQASAQTVFDYTNPDHGPLLSLEAVLQRPTLR